VPHQADEIYGALIRLNLARRRRFSQCLTNKKSPPSCPARRTSEYCGVCSDSRVTGRLINENRRSTSRMSSLARRASRYALAKTDYTHNRIFRPGLRHVRLQPYRPFPPSETGLDLMSFVFEKASPPRTWSFSGS